MLRVSALLSLAVAAAPAVAAAELKGIDVRPSVDRVDVVVTASEPLTFQSWARSSPPVLVVDLLETTAEPATLSPGALKGAATLTGVTVSRHDARGAALSRLSLSLSRNVDYDVSARGSEVTISLFPTGKKEASFSDKKPVQLALSTDRGTRSDAPGLVVEGSLGRATADIDLAQAAGGPLKMSYIGFRNTATSSVVFARLNAEAKFTVRKEGDSLVVLEIQNATIPLRNNKNHLDATFFDSPVKMITPSEIEDATPSIRITIEMKQAAPYEAVLQGREIVVTFKK
ncbi:MAG: hypothetical protein A2138_25665 [Deltaproteobacteria bacterium RBG_16_71_12]|nr:MAG: hypothetical protein A2138_25665 [Deltaproteobacteria bacterium RBG_16_71_12]